MSYHYPRTKEEWWSNVDTYKQDLLETIQESALDDPVNKRLMNDGTVKLCAEFPRKNNPKDHVGMFVKGCDERDADLVISVLNDVWGAAPDCYSIHSRLAWDVLCDLLSEAGVLYD